MEIECCEHCNILKDSVTNLVIIIILLPTKWGKILDAALWGGEQHFRKVPEGLWTQQTPHHPLLFDRPHLGDAGMWKDGLPGVDDVDEGKSLARVFRLTVNTTASPKTSSFRAFFNFSKSFTQTLMKVRVNAM